MKDYELTVVFHPDLEVNPDPAIDKVKKAIAQAGGKIIKEEHEGKRRLAYSIKGQTFALYHYLNISLPSDGPNKLSTTFNITDEILRYMLVRADEKRAKLVAEHPADSELTDSAAEKSNSIDKDNQEEK